MEHRDEIVDRVADVISKDANLIIEVLGTKARCADAIRSAVDGFDDDALREYFKRGYTGWASVEDLIEELDFNEAEEYRQQNELGGWNDDV